jgi:VIT1/CCC1 family predicted Fe2+/Mn2+ transporter
MRLPGPLVRGVLSPYDRASEVLFGLIMALTLTGALSVTSATAQETRALFVSTLSCNVAWGFVDAVMYVLNAVLGRGRHLLLDRALREGTDPAEVRTLLAEVLPESLADGLSAANLEVVRRAVAAQHDLHAPARVQGEDLLAALGVFLLVVAGTFPVALPFLVIPDVAVAKAVSRGLALTLLFVGGYAVGRYSGVRPVSMGLAMLGIGAVLVAAVTALGG